MKDFDDVFLDKWFRYGISLACKELPEYHESIVIWSKWTSRVDPELSRGIEVASKEFCRKNTVEEITTLRQAELEADKEVRREMLSSKGCPNLVKQAEKLSCAYQALMIPSWR